MEKQIEQALKDNGDNVNLLIALDGVIRDINHVFSNRPELNGSVSITIGYGVSMSMDAHVDSLKEVAPLCRALARHGIHVDHKGKIQEGSYGKCYPMICDTAQTWPDGGVRTHSFSLWIYVRSSSGESAACKYVKTGEKTIDVMEWQCESPEAASGDLTGDDSPPVEGGFNGADTLEEQREEV